MICKSSGVNGRRIFLRHFREPFEILATFLAVAKKSRERSGRQGANQSDLVFVRRGRDRFVHERESVTQCLKFARTETEVATAQGVGAAEINTRQLILRLQPPATASSFSMHCVDGVFVAGQTAAIQILDFLLLVRRGSSKKCSEQNMKDQVVATR